MGHITRDIAIIGEPARVALAGLPNYIKFEGRHLSPSVLYTAKLRPPMYGDWSRGDLSLTITTREDETITLQGTLQPEEVTGATFRIVKNDSVATAYNLRAAMLSIDWLASNYKIDVPYALSPSGDSLKEGEVVMVVSKKAGEYYNLVFEEEGSAGAWALEGVTLSINSDSLLAIGGGTSATIELDILDGGNLPVSMDKGLTATVGERIASLQKTYTGEPLWFDINSAVWGTNVLRFRGKTTGVFDSGSLSSYRIAARVAGVNNIPFYLSDALYTVLGQGPLGVEREGVSAPGGDLSGYIVGPSPGRLLSDAPRLPWAQGQPLLINALIGPSVHVQAPDLVAVVEAYNCNGEYLGEGEGSQLIDRTLSLPTISFNPHVIANRWIPLGATLFRAGLKQGGAHMSTFVEFEVLPTAQHPLNYFVFLNRLGGWESFNFCAPTKEETKPTIDTYTRTIRPGYQLGDSVEAVHRARLARTFTVEGAPISDEIARWLPQMAVSPAVFDAKGNAIIIDEMALTIDPERKNMQRPNMKYHLSEQASND